MRRFFSTTLIITGQLLLAGCSISPDQKDVTGLDALTIIKSVRCEAREAIIRNEAEAYKDILADAVIQYGFTFNALEKNKISTEGSFLFPFNGGKLSLLPSAMIDRSREGNNKMDISEKMSNLKTLDCDTPQRKNFIHPIAGRIGIAEIVDRYLRLRYLEVKGNVKTLNFTHELKFKTIVSASLNPIVTLSPSSGRSAILDGALDSSRVDEHILLLTMGSEDYPTAPTALDQERTLRLLEGIRKDVDDPLR